MVIINNFQKKLPEIFQSNFHFKKVLKSLNFLCLNEKINNKNIQIRKYSLNYINNLMIGLTSPLTQILLQYKKCFDNLHPFEVYFSSISYYF